MSLDGAVPSGHQPPSSCNLTCQIVIRRFWIAFVKRPRSVIVPQAAMQRYAAQYQTLKSPRRLKWRPLLGAVELDVTVGDATVPFTVTPLHAVILGQFANAACLTAAQLAAAAGVPQV